MSIGNEKEILKNRLELLIEKKKDLDYKLSETKQAELMDIPYQTFHKYVKGTAECSISNLAKIANYYKVSTDYLLGLTENSSIDESIQNACKVTGLSEDAIHNLHHINFENELNWGNNKEVLNLLIETLDDYLLYKIRVYFYIVKKNDLLDRIILTKYCNDNNLDFTDEEIKKRGEYIFSYNKKYDMLNSYKVYETTIKSLITNNPFDYPFDIDLKEDLDYLKYKLLKELEEWIFNEFEDGLYCNLIDEKFDSKYYDFYSETISCILQETEYKDFCHNPKYVLLSLGVANEILKEKMEREENAEHNPTSE